MGMDASSLHKLEVVFNSCIRYVYSLRKTDSLQNFRKLILGCTLKHFFDYRACVFMHKLLKFKQPAYLFEKIQRGQSTRSNVLIVPLHRSYQEHSSFFARGVTLWNSLPPFVKLIQSPETFATECMKFFAEAV